jgi:two-component system, NtrC family, C4-dicarboxylate transport sensor histidine kinase DctB
MDPSSTPPPPAPSVAKLAAKVAHELNNPLDAVLRFVSLAQRKNQTGDHADVERHLADAQFGLQRMAEILRELMDLGRQTHEVLSQPQRVPLDEILTQALRTVAGIAEQKRIRIAVASAPDAPTSAACDSRLAQILANLLKNAVEASPDNATVGLTIHLQPSPSSGPQQESLFPTDHWPLTTDHLVIAIQDEGPGIDPALLPRLFTPFATTKPRGKGHGLGLAISRDLTASLGGTLTLQNSGRQPGADPSSPQGGCLATIRLPVEQSRS